MFWNSADHVTSTIFYVVEILIVVGTPVWAILKGQKKLDKRLDRIEYAIFNDGKTGLVNKVDSIIEKQSVISEDVAVLKAEIKPVRVRRG